MREIDAIAARCGGRDPEWMDEKRRCAVPEVLVSEHRRRGPRRKIAVPAFDLDRRQPERDFRAPAYLRYFVFNQRQVVVADRLNEYVFRRLRPEFVKLLCLCPPLVFLPLSYRAFRICATEKRMRFGLHTLCLFYLLR